MVDVIPGVVLNNDHTAANLHAMVDAATFSNLELGDFLDTEKPIAKTGTEPTSPEVGQMWFFPNPDSSTSYPAAQFFLWDGTAWRFGGCGLSMLNGSGVTRYRGAPVAQKAGTVGSFDAIDVASFPHRTLGVLAEDAADGESAFIITHGFCRAIIATSSAVIGGAMLPATPAGGSLGAFTAALGPISRGCMGRLLAVEGDDVSDGSYAASTFKRMWCYLTGVLKVTA